MELLGNRRNVTLIGVGLIAVFLLVTSSWVFSPDDNPATTAIGIPTARVLDGVFDIYIIESATLDARQSVTLASELPSNKAKVLALAPEGDLIEQGEVVVKFDPTPFEEDIAKIENDLEEQRAKLTQEEADLTLLEGDDTNRLADLQYQVELAQLKLTTLQEGSVPIRLARVENDLSQARANFEEAKSERLAQEEMFNEGFANANSVQEAKLKELDKLSELRIRERDVAALKDITIPAELKRAQLDVENRQRELQSMQSSLQQKSAQRGAAIRLIRNKIASLEQALASARQQLDNTVITAPVSGIVLYKEISLQNEKRKAQVGDSLWSRHGFAVIPDMSSMVAYVNIREGEVGKISQGQAVTVQPEAYPGLSLPGEVESIGTLGTDESASGTLNVFRVRIALGEMDSRLRPGMSAKASILARHFDNALRIPVQAVFYDGQQTVCFRWEDGEAIRTPISLGDSDGNYIVINEGLAAGQQVLLAYPDSFNES